MQWLHQQRLPLSHPQLQQAQHRTLRRSDGMGAKMLVTKAGRGIFRQARLGWRVLAMITWVLDLVAKMILNCLRNRQRQK